MDDPTDETPDRLDHFGWSDEVVQSWLERSCAAQGVPVRVTDPLTIARVAALLGCQAPTRASQGRELQAPDRLDPSRVDVSRAGQAGSNDSVVQHRGDDGRLAGQAERVPGVQQGLPLAG